MIFLYLLFFLLLLLYEYVCILSVYLGAYSCGDFRYMCLFLLVSDTAFDGGVLGDSHSDCILSDCCLRSCAFQANIDLLLSRICVCSFVPAPSIITYSCRTVYCLRYTVTYIIYSIRSPQILQLSHVFVLPNIMICLILSVCMCHNQIFVCSGMVVGLFCVIYGLCLVHGGMLMLLQSIHAFRW